MQILIRTIGRKHFLQGRSVSKWFVQAPALLLTFTTVVVGLQMYLCFIFCSIVSYKLCDILGVNVLCFPLGQIETISQSDISRVPSRHTDTFIILKPAVTFIMKFYFLV